MKTPLNRAVALLVFGLVVAASAVKARAAGTHIPEITARTNSIAAVVILRQSVFDPDAPGARNLFHPDAVRATRKPTGDDRESSVAAFSHLTLRGIVSGRSAIINNRNFVAGDEANVRLPNGRQVSVKVIEVHEDSVTLTLGGQKEVKTLYARGAAR